MNKYKKILQSYLNESAAGVFDAEELTALVFGDLNFMKKIKLPFITKLKNAWDRIFDISNNSDLRTNISKGLAIYNGKYIKNILKRHGYDDKEIEKIRIISLKASRIAKKATEAKFGSEDEIMKKYNLTVQFWADNKKMSSDEFTLQDIMANYFLFDSEVIEPVKYYFDTYYRTVKGLLKKSTLVKK